MNPLCRFINERSKREIFLFKILWLCCCFFVSFEYFAYPSFLKLQAYNHSKALQSNLNPQEIQEFFTHFNSTSLPYVKIIEILQKNTDVISKIQSQDEKTNYEISLQGKTDSKQFFSLLKKLTSPALLVSSFSLDSTGEFSLSLKNQQIFSLSPPTPLQVLPQQIFDKFSTPTETNIHFVFFTPSQPRSTLVLEAIFNNKAKINGVWLKIGETIENHTLTEIYPHSVILHQDSHPLTLYLRQKRIFQ